MRFDCLCPKSPLFGPHLLEASAGTGKTFAIEHVFVRLILQEIPLEEILVVTFTRAATRELKTRIRSNLEKALNSISDSAPLWPYLEPFMKSDQAIFHLSQALKGFDQAQIFTIHGFCFRMLKEFAFETGSLVSMDDPDHPFEISKKMRAALDLFFNEGVKDLCPEQLSLLFSKYDTIKEIGSALIKAKEPTSKGVSFDAGSKLFKSKLSAWDLTNLKEDFDAIAINYKAKKGDFLTQVDFLQKGDFQKLILHGGSLFSFLAPENKKVRVKTAHSSAFFEWAERELGPIVLDASNRKKIFETLVFAWKKWEVEIASPDEILKEMREAIKLPAFSKKLEEKFQAVIIDEFQDTDPMQWEIFYNTFIIKDSLKALYLVGDPKQSIYRFRNADVYTYFAAKEALGKEHTYRLDTNFRSSKDLIDSLNALFSRSFLKLPKTKGEIPYHPVKAGSKIKSDFGDEKKALHFLIGDKDTSFISYAALEIEKLNLKSVAILVKDRYEGETALNLLRERGIPCVARSHEPLGGTADFLFLREFLDAVLVPNDENLKSIAEEGPFSTDKSFSYWKSYLEEKGLAKFFTALFKETPLSNDLKQTIEEIFAWEQREGFSVDGLKSFLRAFEKLDAEEGARRKMDGVQDAVQILTLHVSKGLEFDVVFALALASGSPASDEEPEEYNAEKLRQLYVAMTRAKKRLYVPFKEKLSEKRLSPMDLFFEGKDVSYIKDISSKYAISYEEVPYMFSMPPVSKIEEPVLEYKIPSFSYTPSYIQSFTSMKKGKDVPIIDSSEEILPRGKETGTVIHEVFEAIFASKNALWKEDEALDAFIEKELQWTSLEEVTPFVQAMIQATLSHPLFDGKQIFSLKELSPDDIFPEMEFFYTKGSNFISGSIDLVFFREKTLYFIDWKTNILRSPTPQGVQEVMRAYDYELQAALYTEALRRHFDKPLDDFFGGAFYLFVRTGSYTHFMPKQY